MKVTTSRVFVMLRAIQNYRRIGQCIGRRKS